MTDKTLDLVTFGETMVLLTSAEIMPLRHVSSFRVSIGGAESNVAIGLARLGHRTAWMGRVGSDEFGALVLSRIRGERVDVDAATIDDSAPTGIMFKGFRAAGVVDVVYYRHGSAASRLAPAHLDQGRIRRARILHVTGITPALGAPPAEAVLAAIDSARGAGALVSFDPNYRARLWEPSVAARCFREIVARVDIVIAGVDEAALICGDGEPSALASKIAALGPREAVVRLAGGGAVGVIDGEELASTAAPVDIVDPVGAGDAFTAGYLSGHLRGQTAAARLDLANSVAAIALRAHGDWEGLPSAEEVRAMPAQVRR